MSSPRVRLAAFLAGLFALTAIAAVILAPQAKREIAAEPDRYDGVGMAQAGLILGWINIGLWAVGIVLFIALVAVGIGTSSTSTYESLAPLLG